jgi:hypothetical protein
MNDGNRFMSQAVGRAALLPWRVTRLFAFSILITLEPVVRLVLSTVALVLLLTAFFFKALGTPHFPFWGMVGFSVGCTVALMAYYGVMSVVSDRREP